MYRILFAVGRTDSHSRVIDVNGNHVKPRARAFPSLVVREATLY